jgi:ATP-dependent Clp protease ATP-binding subunit ClpC
VMTYDKSANAVLVQKQSPEAEAPNKSTKEPAHA